MDASYKIQRGIHVHLIQFFMCPEFWVHINFCSFGLLVWLISGIFIHESTTFININAHYISKTHYRPFFTSNNICASIHGSLFLRIRSVIKPHI